MDVCGGGMVGGTLEYSRRYLMLLMLMFYGTLMFALEYAPRGDGGNAAFVLSSRPAQRSATFSVAPTTDVHIDKWMKYFRIRPFNNLRSRRNVLQRII
jgi:hypothetical protein